MSKKQDLLREQLFRPDGTLIGVSFRQNDPQRGCVYPNIVAALDTNTGKVKRKSFNVSEGFYIKYAAIVEWIALQRGVSERSRIFQEMMDSVDAFKTRYNLQVKVEVRPVEFQTVIFKKKPKKTGR